MRNLFKTVLALIWIVSIPFSLAAAGSAEADAAGASVTGPGVYPIVTSPITLQYMIGSSPQVQDYDDNKMTLYLEERTGIDLEMLIVPGTEYGQRLNIILASGSDMPDILGGALGLSALTQWGQQGVLEPINEYVDEYGYYIDMMFEAHPSLRPAVTSPDGNIYGMPGWQQCFHCQNSYKLWMNEEWLEAIGAGMPQTTDELRDVLQAFQDEDVNGNGRADEVLVGARNGWMQQIEPFILNSFVLWYGEAYARGLMMEEGSVRAAYVTEAYRDALRYMNGLVEDGLLSPLSFTQDQSQYQQLASQDPSPVAAFAHFFGTLGPAERHDDYTYLMPLEGPDGVQWSSWRPFLPIRQGQALIAATGENKAAAFRLLETFYDPEIALWPRYGEPGVDWRPADAGELSVLGDQATIAVLSDVFSRPHRAHWQHNTPFWNDGEVQDHSTYDLFRVADGGTVPSGSPMIESSMALQAYTPPQAMFVPPLAIGLDSVEQFNEIKSTVDSFVQEQQTRFIVGDLDLQADWDEYLETLESIGLSQMLEIMQEAYDRQY